MVYFRCLAVFFFVLCLCVRVFDIPLHRAVLSFVLRNDGETCQEFLILPTDKKGGESEENWKLQRQPQKEESRNRLRREKHILSLFLAD